MQVQKQIKKKGKNSIVWVEVEEHRWITVHG
jgi:hypothetical protein